MGRFDASMDRDANYQVVSSPGSFRTVKTVTFDGAADNGAVGTVNLFTVTGDVLIEFFVAACSEDLAGATATIEVGVTGNTAGILPQTTATNIDSNEIWQTTTPATRTVSLYANGGGVWQPVVGGSDIFVTVGTANITDGTLSFYCRWSPLSDAGNVVAA